MSSLGSGRSSLSWPRLASHGDAEDGTFKFDERDDLHRAEQSLSSVLEKYAGSDVRTTIKYPLTGRYSFSEMANDEAASRQMMEVPPLLAAVWSVSRFAGRWWWPFFVCVVLSERPVEIYVNDESLLHRPDGPALLYRDGTKVWAWEGGHVSEDSMLHPENIPPVQLKRCSPSFRKFVASRAVTPVRKEKLKSSAILKKAMPAQSGERVQMLRTHNGGRLPFFDRYMAGDYQVWEELIVLDRSVRSDPYAADALAVAYEIMSRVDANVRTITARLAALGYESAEEKLRYLPGPGTFKQIARLEKLAGALPLSLRAFYDVIGSVDLIGEHPSIAPPDESITPDPLVVNSVEDALEQFDDEGPDPDREQFLIVIAPDALHKANISGGEPYEIALPDLRADGPLLWERHELYFVEYLRLAFRFGGFPGYEGIDPLPAELEILTAGLVPF